MSESATWIEQFGLNNRTTPEFFSDLSQLSSAVPQAHLLRRGFNDLELDGVLCAENTPLDGAPLIRPASLTRSVSSPTLRLQTNTQKEALSLHYSVIILNVCITDRC